MAYGRSYQDTNIRIADVAECDKNRAALFSPRSFVFFAVINFFCCAAMIDSCFKLITTLIEAAMLICIVFLVSLRVRAYPRIVEVWNSLRCLGSKVFLTPSPQTILG